MRTPETVNGGPRPHLSLLVVAVVLAAALAPAEGVARTKSYTVMDFNTGKVLKSVNPDVQLHPASLTKMMTLYLAFEAIRNGELSMDQKVKVSRKASRIPPSRLGLRAGQFVRVRHLIAAAAVKSANDAAVVLAEAISGSEARFARLMTERARQLGMYNTSFVNATGFTQRGHLSTARDMAILGNRLIHDFPDQLPTFKRQFIRWGGRKVPATNRRFLRAYSGADGLKTGYTRAAGYTMVATAKRKGRRLVVSYFGARSSGRRTTRVAQLMNDGFRMLESGAVLVASTAPVPPAPRPQTATSGIPVVRVVGGASDTGSAVDSRPVHAAVGSEGNWAIQVGAYKSKRLASRRLVRVAEDHAPLIVGGAPRVSRRGKLYLSRFTGFSRDYARRACKDLQSRQVECLALELVLLPPPVPVAPVIRANTASFDSTSPATASTGSWAIQVGAYGRSSRARKRLEEIRRAGYEWLGDRPIRIPKSGKYYLAQFLGFDADSANRACAEFKKQAADCLPIRLRRPRQAALDGGSWSIQVGAFRRASNARQEMARVKAVGLDELAGKEPAFPRQGRNTLVRLTGFDRYSAAGACDSLRARGFECLPIAPRNMQAGTRKASVRSDWSIQVGAYGRAGQARAQIQRVAARKIEELSDARTWVPKQGRYYLARFRNLDESTATSACSALLAKGVDCLALAPVRR